MGEPPLPLEDVTQDALLDGAVRLIQPRRGHRAGTDAVLLAALVPAGDGDTVVDLGSGSGAVGLMVASRAPGARLVFVERDPALVDLCRRNMALNGLAERAEAATADAFDLRASPGLRPGMASVVVTNPPFLEHGRDGSSPDEGRRTAHTLSGGDLSGWIRAAAWLLQARGRLSLIHRADRLDAVLNALAGFGGIELTFVHPDERGAASRVLVSGLKGSRAPLRVLPPLVLHGPGGSFTVAAAILHRPVLDEEGRPKAPRSTYRSKQTRRGP